MWKTNLPSNTAFRGFGGPQGMAVIETVIDRIARELGLDAALVRKRNFYGINDRNITHYGEKVDHNRLFMIYEPLIKSSDYITRRKEINKYNSRNEFFKKGIALTPVKFGISFTTTFLNQAAALVNIYKDGSAIVNHGGVEMGQGLHTKIHNIVSLELGIDEELIRVTATNTSKVPNTSATAASSGSDMNGMAVKNAIDKLKIRLGKIFHEEYKRHLKLTRPENNDEILTKLVFSNNSVYHRDKPALRISFKELISMAYFSRVSLSATGFYKTPEIFYDKDKGKGQPFYYFAFGMAVSEVMLDTLTGHHKILRSDILHDVGDSLNPDIDYGQIEGGFIQGIGWCTTEDIKWDANGNLLNHSPDTYKIPTIYDIPEIFRVKILEDAPHPNTIRKSKAVGEPPFMLAFSVWLAIKDAISSIGKHKYEPKFSLPATNEVILKSLDDLKNKIKGESLY
jgi:xanthine dehydrogenase molybdopterin-binding subunit B